MLRNAKMGRASIQYRGVIKYRIDPNRLLGLVSALRSGSDAAAYEIIIGHLQLTISLAARYAYRSPKKTQDITGVAVLALCDCVERIRTGLSLKEHNNITGYIITYVTGKISNFLKVDHTVRPPLESDWLLREYKKHGREFLFQYFGTISYDRIVSATESEIKYKIAEPHTRDPYEIMFVNEILESKHFTRRERIIMRLKWEGETDAEIASIFGMSTSSITKIRQQLRSRVRELMK